MGWQFTLAEFIGGPIMIVAVVLGFRLWKRGRIVDAARKQAERGLAESMEGHAAMDMSVQSEGTLRPRLPSRDGFTSVSPFYVMDWASVIRNIAIGLLIAGAFAAWVPTDRLQTFFLTNDPTAAKICGPVIGPLVAVLSFVCSIGNVPLAVVLWNGGISFGGVVSFIFADLIIIPIILIYRKYYGTEAALRITGTFLPRHGASRRIPHRGPLRRPAPDPDHPKRHRHRRRFALRQRSCRDHGSCYGRDQASLSPSGS